MTRVVVLVLLLTACDYRPTVPGTPTAPSATNPTVPPDSVPSPRAPSTPSDSTPALPGFGVPVPPPAAICTIYEVTVSPNGDSATTLTCLDSTDTGPVVGNASHQRHVRPN